MRYVEIVHRIIGADNIVRLSCVFLSLNATGNLVVDSNHDEDLSIENWRHQKQRNNDETNDDYINKPHYNDLMLHNNGYGRESFNLSMVTLVLLTIVVFIFFANWYRKRWFGSTKIRRLFHKLLGS